MTLQEKMKMFEARGYKVLERVQIEHTYGIDLRNPLDDEYDATSYEANRIEEGYDYIDDSTEYRIEKDGEMIKCQLDWDDVIEFIEETIVG